MNREKDDEQVEEERSSGMERLDLETGSEVDSSRFERTETAK